MPTYIYKAYDLQGKLVRGRKVFSTKSHLADDLKKEGFLLIDVKEEAPRFKILESIKKIQVFKPRSAEIEEKKDIFDVFQKIKTRDIVYFGLQLSNMLGVGIPLLDSLGIIVRQASNKKLEKIIKKIYRDVQSGSSFSLALKLYPQFFSPLFISMVRLGEATGHLDNTLSKLTDFLQHDMDLKQKFQSALIYPCILCIIGFLVVMFLTIFIMPQFIEMFKSANVALPLPTMLIYVFGQAVVRFWYLFILGSIGLIFGIKFYLKRESARLIFDRAILEIPVIGPLVHKIILSRLAMTLSVLVAAGVPLLESLRMIENAVGNLVIAQVIKGAYAKISKGTKIADALKVSDKFPPDMIEMIAIGEETGSLDKMLAKISDFYNYDVDSAIKRLSVLIEPLFLGIMGTIVGFIMFSLLLPLFKMVAAVHA